MPTFRAHLHSRLMSRRRFIEGAIALGMSAAAAKSLAREASGQQATRSATMPDTSPGHRGRGAGGELRLLQWRAPAQLSPHHATSDPDVRAAQPVLEPLMRYGPDSSLIATLISTVPSVENGLLAEDSSAVTFTLLPDVTWSNGEPFTAHDVEFTWAWTTDPVNETSTAGIWGEMAAVEAVDELTVRATFARPSPHWFLPFANHGAGSIYPRHILADGSINDFRLRPTGTGPYVVESFTPNDQVTYTINQHYRETGGPFFSRIVLQDGGDTLAPTRPAMPTGHDDFFWYTGFDR